MKTKWIASCVLLFFLATLATHAETVYERVMRTGKIRAGYGIYPPGVIKDPNTGKLSGAAVEALNKAAENLQLKVEYVEEIPWGNMIEAINSDRVDVVLYVWANSTRARMVDFSTPLFYSVINAYARPDDKRFANGLAEGMKDPAVTVSGMDGEMSLMIAKADYPKNKTLGIAQGEFAQTLLAVVHKKADVIFTEAPTVHDFLKHNPNTLKNITPDRPVRVFPNTFMIKRGQMEFKNMLDRALEELHNSGVIDQLVSKYEPYPNAVYRVALPYRTK
jgi:polar amino acid transport system substrate-binding protein